MNKHHFPENWWMPELGVRYMTANGELYNCATAEPTGLSVNRPVELGEI